MTNQQPHSRFNAFSTIDGQFSSNLGMKSTLTFTTAEKDHLIACKAIPSETYNRDIDRESFQDKNSDFREIDDYLTTNFDNFPLKYSVNEAKDDFARLESTNKRLHGLLISNQLGPFESIQNSMLPSNPIRPKDQNLNLFQTEFEDFNYRHLPNVNQRNSDQLNSDQLFQGQFNPSLPSKGLANNKIPDSRSENYLQPLHSCRIPALSESQNSLRDHRYTGSGLLEVGCNSHDDKSPKESMNLFGNLVGSEVSSNQGNFLKPTARIRYWSNLNKLFPETLSGFRQRLDPSTAQQFSPIIAPNLVRTDPDALRFKDSINSGPTSFRGESSPTSIFSNQKQWEQNSRLDKNRLSSMSPSKESSNRTPQNMPTAQTKPDLMNYGKNNDSYYRQANRLNKELPFCGLGFDAYLAWHRKFKIERAWKIAKYKFKKLIRMNRLSDECQKKVSYECRKKVADSRLRIHGRFISKHEHVKIAQLLVEKQEKAFSSKNDLDLQYMVAKSNIKLEADNEGLSTVTMRSNMLKEDLSKKGKGAINSGKRTIDTYCGKKLDRSTAQTSQRKKIFKIIYNRHRRTEPSFSNAKATSPQKTNLAPVMNFRDSIKDVQQASAITSENFDPSMLVPKKTAQDDRSLTDQSIQVSQENYDPRSIENQTAHQSLMLQLLGAAEVSSKGITKSEYYPTESQDS